MDPLFLDQSWKSFPIALETVTFFLCFISSITGVCLFVNDLISFVSFVLNISDFDRLLHQGWVQRWGLQDWGALMKTVKGKKKTFSLLREALFLPWRTAVIFTMPRGQGRQHSFSSLLCTGSSSIKVINRSYNCHYN